MAGALVHIAAGLISAAVVHLKHFRLEYSLAIFIGNLLPDAIKFGISAFLQGTLRAFSIKQDNAYHILSAVTSNPQNWFTAGFFVITTMWLLYHYHVIKKKGLWEYDELYIFLLTGAITHLILDVFVIEKGVWL